MAASNVIQMVKIGREPVRDYLRAQGGEVTSLNGQGLTQEIAKATGYKLDSLGRILADMERDGEIVRDVRGRRTFRIALHGHLDGGSGHYQRLRTAADLVGEIHRMRGSIAQKEDRVRELLGGMMPDEDIEEMLG